MSKHKKTISDKIASIIAPQVTTIDPESHELKARSSADEFSSSSDENEILQPSESKMHEEWLKQEMKQKYKGEIKPKSEVFCDENSDSDSIEDVAESSELSSVKDADESSGLSSIEDDLDENYLKEKKALKTSLKEPKEKKRTTNTREKESFIKKNQELKEQAESVRLQIKNWEYLLNMIILMQKIINEVHRLPKPEMAPLYQKESKKYEKVVEKTKKLTYLLAKYFLNICSDIKISEGMNPYQDMLEVLSKHKQNIESYHEKTLKEWSDETIGLDLTTEKKFKFINISILHQVKNHISLPETLQKTQTIKDENFNFIGEFNKQALEPISVEDKDGDQEQKKRVIDKEIYNDYGFYNKLLREFIDSKTGSNKAHEWTSTQPKKKPRSNKDKVSRDRKIKYNIHEKLVCYMPPRNYAKWNASMIDNLFSNLFGCSNKKEPTLDETVKNEGFKLFE